MTSYYPLVLSNTKPPSFMPIFDGYQYTITVLWNISGQRYYIMCQSSNNTLIFMVPLIDSSVGVEIESLVWDEVDEVVIATLAAPHELPIGEIFNVSIIQAVPNGYNGNGMALITSDTSFTYPMKQDPGPVQQAGVAQFLISMTKSYFNSTLVFRNMQFEVTP
jgi:hypothetical protein